MLLASKVAVISKALCDEVVSVDSGTSQTPRIPATPSKIHFAHLKHVAFSTPKFRETTIYKLQCGVCKAPQTLSTPKPSLGLGGCRGPIWAAGHRRGRRAPRALGPPLWVRRLRGLVQDAAALARAAPRIDESMSGWVPVLQVPDLFYRFFFGKFRTPY